MATETLQRPSFDMAADPSSFHQVSMAAAAAGSAAAAQASMYSHHPTSMMPSNAYFSRQQQEHHHHPYYTSYFNPTPSDYGSSPFLDPYHGDFRPTFYNPFEIKHRRRTSRAQLKVLEKSFMENAKPNASVRRYLAQELEMTPRGVQIWFQNRRAKAKLQKRKSQQANATAADPTTTTIATNTFLMTPISTSASPKSSSSSSSLLSTPSTSSSFVSSPTAADSLFYPVDDLHSMSTQSLLMADQAWMTRPMHPLHQQQQHSNDIQRRQSCPLLNNDSSLWDPSVLQQQTRRASDYPIFSASNTLNNQSLGWLDTTDGNSCSGSSNNCETPKWATPSQYSAQQYSPMVDNTILELCQQQQQHANCTYAPASTTSLDFDPSIPSLMSCLI